MNLKGLHEMLFGTVPLAQQKTTKIHFLKSEHRIFLTKIFSLRLAADHDLLPSNVIFVFIFFPKDFFFLKFLFYLNYT